MVLLILACNDMENNGTPTRRELSRKDKLTLLRWLSNNEINLCELYELRNEKQSSVTVEELNKELAHLIKSNDDGGERGILQAIVYACVNWYTAEEIRRILDYTSTPRHSQTEQDVRQLITPSKDSTGEKQRKIFALYDYMKSTLEL